MNPYLRRQFPTLLVTIPRTARSLAGASLAAAKQLQRQMTWPRVAVGALAIAVVPIEIDVRRRRFEARAAEHESKMISGMGCSRIGPPSFYDGHGRLMTAAEVNAANWHAKLAGKYRLAATRPWLPVEPDPPPQ